MLLHPDEGIRAIIPFTECLGSTASDCHILSDCTPFAALPNAPPQALPVGTLGECGTESLEMKHAQYRVGADFLFSRKRLMNHEKRFLKQQLPKVEEPVAKHPHGLAKTKAAGLTKMVKLETRSVGDHDLNMVKSVARF